MKSKLAKFEIVGSYEWYVNQSKPEGADYTAWARETRKATCDRLKAMDIVGKRVRIEVRGGSRPMRYTGTVDCIVSDTVSGGCVHLKQNKGTKYIDTWQVQDVEIISE